MLVRIRKFPTNPWINELIYCVPDVTPLWVRLEDNSTRFLTSGLFISRTQPNPIIYFRIPPRYSNSKLDVTIAASSHCLLYITAGSQN